MTTTGASFPLTVNVLDVPFNIVPNPDFMGEATPLCILRNLGAPPNPDTFIVTGSAKPPPEGPDPWEIEFHWATAGPASFGVWLVDAWLESVTQGANIQVPSAGLPRPVALAANQRYAPILGIAAGAVPLPAPSPPLEPLAAHLYKLYTVVRWAEFPGGPVRVACLGQGPLIEFYQAEV